MKQYQTGVVTIRGVEYPSAKAAAAALGVKPQTVAQARQRGTLDKVALGLSGNAEGDSNRRQTLICGVEYESRKAAALALGVSYSALSSFLSVAEYLGIDVT